MLRAVTTEEPPDDGRVVIKMNAELAQNVDSASDAIATDPELYSREHGIVQIQIGAAADGVIAGTPIVRRIVTATLKERVTRVARFAKYSKSEGRWVASTPNDDIVSALWNRGDWPGMRYLDGVIETPSIRPDGSVIDVAGYDARTRYLYCPPISFLSPNDAPTQLDAVKALAELCDVFVDFPFASDAARYVPIAAAMTILARPAIRGAVPGFVFDAPTPGTGKSLCADAVCTLATGRGAPRGTFPATDRGTVDCVELEKILSSFALMGANVVGFDNLASGFGGAPLDKVLTAHDRVQFRILGKTDVPSVRWNATILASGNNVSILGDTIRRVLMARMESNVEKPEDRTGFTHYPLLPWLRTERPRLVRAILTILRAYAVSDRWGRGPKWGSFEEWSELIVGSLLYAGAPNILECRPTADSGDTGEREAYLAILYPNDHGEQRAPDAFDPMRDAIESLSPTRGGMKPDVAKVGRVFRSIRNRVFDGKKLVSLGNTAGALRWYVRG